MAERLPADVRAANFKQLTRRNWQSLGSRVIAGTGGSTIFELPRARLLAGLRVLIEATLTATHASDTTVDAADLAPYSLVKKMLLNLNNGFAPIELTGANLYALQMALNGVPVSAPATSGRGRAVLGLTASSGGTANVVRLELDVPCEVNARDPVGLILLQNVDTLATLEVQTGAAADIAALSGGTVSLGNVTVTVMTDTYSIPADPNAVPDISILKSYKGRTETLQAGENVIKLPVGQTYRKLWFIIRNGSAVRQADSFVTSPIELVLDQNEAPYKAPAQILAGENTKDYDGALPDGLYVFDFATAGDARNLASSRDLIDTQRITEFWLRFSTSGAGTIEYGYETLSKLAGL